jgi:hypothetical protein
LKRFQLERVSMGYLFANGGVEATRTFVSMIITKPSCIENPRIEFLMKSIYDKRLSPNDNM